MANNYTNFGIAGVKVKILDELPYIDTNPRHFQFDISANQVDGFGACSIPSLFIELIENKEKSFSALIPSRRKFLIDNYLQSSDKSSIIPKNNSVKVIWRTVSTMPSGLREKILEYIKIYGNHPDNYKLYANPLYKGPIWDDIDQEKVPPPNDNALISLYFKSLAGELDEKDAEKEVEKANEISEELGATKWIWQKKMSWGMLWAVESSSFLSEDMPFWVNIKKYSSPTSTADELTSFVAISIGMDEPKNRFDLFLSENSKPVLIDYAGDKSGNPINHEFADESARLTGSEGEYEIGFMTVAGRLVIFVNKSVLIYDRSEQIASTGTEQTKTSAKEGSLSPCKIGKGRIQITGSNFSCYINTCPMTFAPMGVFSLSIPEVIDGQDESKKAKKNKGAWFGVDSNNKPRGSVAELPGAGSKTTVIYGVDCEEFDGDFGKCNPKGQFFHKQGVISVKSVDIGNNKNENAEKITLAFLKPSDVETDNYIIPLGGCPYYFRLKGVWSKEQKSPDNGGLDASDDVLNVSESFSSNEWHSISKQCSVTLYNNNGKYNHLLKTQKGITLSWGWNSNYEKTFTGIVNSYAVSERAGNETITLTCLDYMLILETNYVVNSPYYDGMVGRCALEDISKRIGIMEFVIDWENEEDYFLPSSYAWTAPLWKLEDMTTYKDGMTRMLDLFEAFMYFDGDGKLHLKKVPGGIIGDTNEESAKDNFYQSPDGNDKDHVILENKDLTISYADTVNNINILTVERDTNNVIYHNEPAEENKILYRKTLFLDQPAYGELDVATGYAKELGERVFNPILDISFKTVGFNSALMPYDFVTVKDQLFRITSMKREYSSESNDFSQTFECSWGAP